MAVVAAVAGIEPAGGAFAVAVALVLAPVAVWAVAGIAERIAGPRFAAVAAALYALLPLAGRALFYGPLHAAYRGHILPALVGTQAPAWFALGVGLAVVVRLAPSRAAGVAALVAAVVAGVLWIDTDWTTLYDNLHESTWSPTLVCALPFACALGVWLRSPWAAAALGGWLGFFVLRGVHRPYGSGAFWTGLAAAMPAVAVLIASLALLVPRLRPEPAPATDAR
ncbi:MAG: hypothetical protein ACXVRD_13360 [Gaiellaceae bacterium]